MVSKFRGAEVTVEFLFKRLAGTVKKDLGWWRDLQEGGWGKNLKRTESYRRKRDFHEKHTRVERHTGGRDLQERGEIYREVKKLTGVQRLT